MHDERRRYFRISDQIGVAYYPVSEADESHLTEVEGVNQLLSDCDATIARLLSELAPEEPRWVELAACLNQKIDCVIGQLQADGSFRGRLEHSLYSVNISACGLGLRLEDTLAIGTELMLDLLLLPERRRLKTLARVVGSDPVVDGRNYVRFDFVDLGSAEQEELIQHIVRRQGDLLRQARETAEQQ